MLALLYFATVFFIVLWRAWYNSKCHHSKGLNLYSFAKLFDEGCGLETIRTSFTQRKLLDYKGERQELSLQVNYYAWLVKYITHKKSIHITKSTKTPVK